MRPAAAISFRRRRRFLGYKAIMPMYVKLILACILCLAVIAGLVLLVQRLF
jgi:hypothetical protein